MKVVYKQRAFFPVGALMVVLWVAAPGDARAYIDPGNGAYMVQALFTLAGAALFYIRHPIRSFHTMKQWLTSRIRRRNDREADLAPERLLDE